MKVDTRLEIETILESYLKGAAIGCTVFALIFTYNRVYHIGIPLLCVAVASAILYKLTDCAYFIDGSNETIYYQRKMFAHCHRHTLCHFKDVVRVRAVEKVDGKDSSHGEVQIKLAARPVGTEWVPVQHCKNVGIANGKGAKLAKRLGVEFQEGLSLKSVKIVHDDSSKLKSIFIPSHGSAPIDLLAGSYRISCYSPLTSVAIFAYLGETIIGLLAMVGFAVEGRIGGALLFLGLIFLASKFANSGAYFQFDENKSSYSLLESFGIFERQRMIGHQSDIVSVSIESDYCRPKGELPFFVYRPTLIFANGEKFAMVEDPIRKLSKANQVAQAMAAFHEVTYIPGKEGKSLSISFDEKHGQIKAQQVDFDNRNYWLEFFVQLVASVTAVVLPFFLTLYLALILSF